MSWLGGLKSFQIYSHGNVTEKKENPKQIKTVTTFFLPAMPSHFGISVSLIQEVLLLLGSFQ